MKKKREGESRRTRTGRVLTFVLGVILLCGFTLFPLLQWLEARRWAAVPCRVLDRGIRVDSSGIDQPFLRYTFVLNGHEYIGDRIRFGIASDQEASEFVRPEVADRFVPGAMLTCFADPRDPDRSTLYRAISHWSWILGAISTVMILIALFGHAADEGNG